MKSSNNHQSGAADTSTLTVTTPGQSKSTDQMTEEEKKRDQQEKAQQDEKERRDKAIKHRLDAGADYNYAKGIIWQPVNIDVEEYNEYMKTHQPGMKGVGAFNYYAPSGIYRKEGSAADGKKDYLIDLWGILLQVQVAQF